MNHTATAAIKVGKKVYKVTAISPYAFLGCGKLKTLNVNSRFLTARKVKGCLKGSAVNKVKVQKGAKEVLETYKEIFAKKNTGAPKKVSVKKKK